MRETRSYFSLLISVMLNVSSKTWASAMMGFGEGGKAGGEKVLGRADVVVVVVAVAIALLCLGQKKEWEARAGDGHLLARTPDASPPPQRRLHHRLAYDT